MSTLPEVGLYVSTKKTDGMRLIVEGVYGENTDEFYLVEVIDESRQDDPSAASDELDKNQWESLCAEYGLVFKQD